MGISGIYGINAGVQSVAAAKAILPRGGFVVDIVFGEHLPSADGTVDLLHHQAALADFVAARLIQFNKDDFVRVFITAIQDSPEKLAIIQLAIVAEFVVMLFACCQNGIVVVDRSHAFELHFEVLLSFNENGLFGFLSFLSFVQ
jgi:hypothetical protein